LAHTWTCHFGALTAGIFFRRKVIDQGLLFNTSYRAVADAEWFLRILQSGLGVEPLRTTTSTFMEGGDNLGLSATAIAECGRLTRSAPVWIRALRPWWVVWHRARRVAAGAHRPENITYAVHLLDNLKRTSFSVKKLRTTWPGRVWNY